jgi:hypothetical protein
MAQIIKIKRGGIESFISSTPTLAQGELVLATGSLSEGIKDTFFIASASNSPTLPYAKVETITNGLTLAGQLDNNFEGLLIHSSSDNKFYRYNGSAFVELPVAAGSFDGTLGVGSGGTGLDSISNNHMLVGNAGGTGFDTVNMGTNGVVLVGGDVPKPVALATFAGTGLEASNVGNGTGQIDVEAAQTVITSVKNNSLVIGRNEPAHNEEISFATDDQVQIITSGSARVTVAHATTTITNDLAVSGDATITGDLIVQGTTTTVNSSTLNVSSSIIRANYGGAAVKGGLEVSDATGTNLVTGSLLWNGANGADYWEAGPQGSEKRIALFEATNPTDNGFLHLNGSDRIVSVAQGAAGAFLQSDGDGTYTVSNVVDGGTY